MRGFRLFMLIGVLAAMSLPMVSTPTAQAPVRDAAAVLAEAREALGGEKRLSAVKNFVVTGRTRQVRGDNLVPIEFEIAVELPDKYVRKDEIPAQESGPTSTGFNGDELIQLPVPATPTPPAGVGRAGGPATPPSPAQLETARKTRVATVKEDFVRLTLGMFAGSFSSYPLTFKYVGQAEAPQGKADVVEAKAAPNFTVRLFVNSQTHLPIMVSWQAAARPTGPPRGGGPPAGRGETPGPGPTPPGRGAPTAPPPGVQPPGAGAPAAGVPPPPPGQVPSASQPPTLPPGASAGQGQPAPPGAPAGQGPPTAPPGASARQGQPAAPGASASQGGRYGPPAAPVEQSIYFSYREVDGLKWPFRLRRATGEDNMRRPHARSVQDNRRSTEEVEVRKEVSAVIGAVSSSVLTAAPCTSPSTDGQVIVTVSIQRPVITDARSRSSARRGHQGCRDCTFRRATRGRPDRKRPAGTLYIKGPFQVSARCEGSPPSTRRQQARGVLPSRRWKAGTFRRDAQSVVRSAQHVRHRADARAD